MTEPKRGYPLNGCSAVEQMIGLDLVGNLTPHSWYEALKRDNKRGAAKPHLNAIVLLSDIVYWFRPIIDERDELTGKPLGWRKKFKDEKLQKSYGALAEFFGMSKKQVREALKFLEDQGLITLERKNLVVQGLHLSNVLYIDLNVTRLKEITYSKMLRNQDAIEDQAVSLQGTPPSLVVQRVAPEEGTYTETTHETSLETSLEGNNAGAKDAPAGADAPIPEAKSLKTGTSDQCPPETDRRVREYLNLPARS